MAIFFDYVKITSQLIEAFKVRKYTAIITFLVALYRGIIFKSALISNLIEKYDLSISNSQKSHTKE